MAQDPILPSLLTVGGRVSTGCANRTGSLIGVSLWTQMDTVANHEVFTGHVNRVPGLNGASTSKRSLLLPARCEPRSSGAWLRRVGVTGDSEPLSGSQASL